MWVTSQIFYFVCLFVFAGGFLFVFRLLYKSILYSSKTRIWGVFCLYHFLLLWSWKFTTTRHMNDCQSLVKNAVRKGLRKNKRLNRITFLTIKIHNFQDSCCLNELKLSCFDSTKKCGDTSIAVVTVCLGLKNNVKNNMDAFKRSRICFGKG